MAALGLVEEIIAHATKTIANAANVTTLNV
jgi:hypothetical protein